MPAKQKILIVDDDTNIAELISLYLTKEFYQVQIVEDGEQALQVFDTFQPNLVLLDLMLPGMDGYQVCRELRSRSNTPIIMLSAKGEVFDKVLGLELGADDYMIKPFDSKELVARVKAVLRRFQPSRTDEVPTAKIVQYPDLIIPLFIREIPLICRPRNWNSSISSPLHPIRYLPENSFWIISGAMNTLVIPEPSMCISSV